MCGCCVWIRAGISVSVRIRVRDGVRISNGVMRRVKLVNYSLLTARQNVVSDAIQIY